MSITRMPTFKMHPVNRAAVILIGGYSTRMGTDKSMLCYHRKTQREHLSSVFSGLGFRVLFAGRKEQQRHEPHFIVDACEDSGPVAGIVSTLRHIQHNQAKVQYEDWLFVSSCDQPLLDQSIITDLWQQSHSVSPPRVMMHCYRHREHPGRIEPFPSVWHTDAIAQCRQALSNQRYAVRHILQPDQICSHHCPDYSKLVNINSPEQRQMLEHSNKLP